MSVRDPAPERERGDRSFTEVFSHALRGRPCRVIGLAAGTQELPVHAWRRDADERDLALIVQCRGRVLDVGCGPGRLTEALAARGHFVLGIDVVDEAVTQTRRRGVSAVHGDVFDRIPGEGRWGTILLADGNIGIGGDPTALLDRARRLLVPGGRVVVEVEAPGVPLSSQWITLECEGHTSRPFRWAVVGADDLDHLASAAGLVVEDVRQLGGERWSAVLRPLTDQLGWTGDDETS